MILQITHHVVDCPICGRPLEIQSQLVSQEIGCGHCHGEFTVSEMDDGSLTTNRKGMDLMERAELLLRATGDIQIPVAEHRCHRPHSLVSVSEKREPSENISLLTLKEIECIPESLPTTLLVEQRDEVFARIATDLAEFGMRVVRAKSATEALKLSGKYKPRLIVAHVNLQDQSGWLLAGKLGFVDRRIHIWLYQPLSSSYDRGLAGFLNVAELVDYRGDLFCLSEKIVELMANLSKLSDASGGTNRSGESRAG